MFYLMTHSTHFIYGYMASDILLRTILIVRKETRCHHIGYSLRLTARVLLYAPSHRQDSTYHSLCYTSRVALAGTRNSSMGSPHEGSIRWPITPWANALTTELHRKEGNVLFNNELNTFYSRLYGVWHIAKDHSYWKRKCDAATSWAMLNSSKGSFIGTILHRIIYTKTFVTQVVKHWMEQEIFQLVHHEGSIQ